MNFVYQANDGDCGFASLKMLLSYYQKDKNYLYLKKQDEKKKNYSFSDLSSIANFEGVTLKSLKNVDLENQEITKKPFLAVIKNNDYNHMVFIKKTYRKHLLVYDPDSGIKLVSMEIFKKSFTGFVMIVDEISHKKCDNKKDNIVKSSKIIGLFIIQIISICVFFISLSSVAFQLKDTITIILFSFYIILELIYEFFLLKILKSFDENYLPLLSRSENKGKGLGIINDYKKSMFGKPFECFSSIIIVISIIVILLINGRIYFAIFFAAGLVLTIVSILSYSKINKIKNNSIKKENEIINGNLNDIKPFLNSTYQIVSFSILNKFLFIILGIGCSLTLMLLLKENSLNFVIFYLFIYVLGLEKLYSIINFALESQERQKLDAEFRDLFLWFYIVRSFSL